ncbi:3-oxoacyl-ACP synthase [Ammoniphilus oxalaticus]|uniref:Beta-ketoacyl-[acyl-carrier-protein] synthase III n=1 Tax=Ammoniphilus oxalaticus TaxID=66863 RepID=A0A419SK58_9BACL|nr:beta-ketoacyl-ACP synthase III [Ammoniphilus oxalaticus]RKD24355.1 3-oxoacyl-ACP synthase [Ammoniphilus oxalaticus]
MKRAGIIGIGHYVPETVVTNKDLEEKLDTSDEWITTRTGIRERRIASDEMDTSDLATQAALAAIENAGIGVEEIDLILVATSTADYHGFPSVACLVQNKLKAKTVGAMDVSAACSGFIYAMVMAKQFIETGANQRVLVIGAEKMSKMVDWSDRNTAVLFGDGAGAVILGPVSEDRGILSYEMGADGSGADELFVDDYLQMNGREVFKFAVRQMPDTIQRVVDQAGLTVSEVDFLIPHQANTRIIQSAADKLGIPEQKVSVTVDKYGNTSSASIPLSLVQEVQLGKIEDGDLLVLVGFGAGLTWASLTLRWGK